MNTNTEKLQNKIDTIRGDIHAMKRDIQTTKTDIIIMKSDSSIMKADISDIFEKLRRLDKIEKQLDWLVGAYQRADEERLIHTQYHEDLTHKVDDHDKRIKKLERTTTAA